MPVFPLDNCLSGGYNEGTLKDKLLQQELAWSITIGRIARKLLKRK